MTTRPCPTCHAPAELEVVPESAMQAGDVVVRVAGLARGRCRDGHVHLLPEEAADTARAAVDEQLLVARERGVVRRRRVCGDCGADLVLPPTRTERAVPVDVAGTVLTVTVRAAMLRCPDCAREQLAPDDAAAMPAALEAAVEAALADG